MPASETRGFSLVEVLIALAFLGALTMGASSLLAFLSSRAANTRDSMTSHLLAMERLENSLAAGYDALPVGVATDPALAEHPGFSARLEVSQAGPRLRRVKIVIEGLGGADSLETMVADQN